MNCVRRWSGSDQSPASGGGHQTFKITQTSNTITHHLPPVERSIQLALSLICWPQSGLRFEGWSACNALHDNCPHYRTSQQVRLPGSPLSATYSSDGSFMTSLSQFIPIWIYKFDKQIQREINVFHPDEIIIWIDETRNLLGIHFSSSRKMARKEQIITTITFHLSLCIGCKNHPNLFYYYENFMWHFL